MGIGPFGLFGARFDLPEFTLGFLLAVLIFVVAFRLRPIASFLKATATVGIERARETFTSGAADNYGSEVTAWAELQHAAQAIFNLSEIVIPPRVLAPPQMTSPGREDMPSAGTLAVLPNLPDWTYLSGVYAAPSLDLRTAVAQGTPMMLTGPLGSGKTSALCFLAIEAAAGRFTIRDGEPLLPVLVHAADLNLTRNSIDEPAKALIEGVQTYASANLTPRLPSYLRRHLEARQAMILVDGLDELTQDELGVVSRWLSALRRAHPGNIFVLAGPSQGYDGITAAGFAPVSIAPWTKYHVQEFQRKWGTAWQEVVVPNLPRNSLDDIDPALIIGWLEGPGRTLTALETALRTWAAFAGDIRGKEIRHQYESYLSRFLSAEERKSATTAGLTWIEARVGAIDDSNLPRGIPAGDLVKAGILTRRTSGRLSFSVPAVGAFLAGLGMAELGVPENIDKDYWLPAETALGFHAGFVDATDEVEHKLKAGDDPLRSSVLTAARWLRTAPEDLAWRSKVLRSLGTIIQDHTLPYGLRLRATHAMAQSREPSATVFFQRLMGSQHVTSRILGALGLGGTHDTKGLEVLTDALSNDSDLRVRQAACLALAAIGTEQAMEALGKNLLQADEAVRVAAAEALAVHTGEGHDMLRDAHSIKDAQTRRAALFGLSRVPTKWAEDLIERSQVEDEQWIVRGAAAEALESRRNPKWRIEAPLREAADLPWLKAYAASEGQGIAPGRAALEMLRKALANGSPEQRIAAIEALGWVGGKALEMELQQALQGGEPYLKDAAFESLWRQSAAGQDFEMVPPAMEVEAA